jgi:Tfp pilus assembly protein PilF
MTTRISILICTLFFLAGNMMAQQSAQSWVEKGDQAFKQFNPKEASLYYTQAIKTDKKHWEAYFKRSIVLLLLGECDLAEADIQKCQKAKWDATEIEVRKGYVATCRGEIEQALAIFQNITAKNPNNTDALFAAAGILKLMKRYEEAADHYSRYNAIKTQNVTAHFEWVECLYELQQYEKMAQALEQLLKLDPEHEKGLSFRAEYYYRKDQLDLAIKDYRTLIRINPNNMMVYNNLGYFLGAQNRYAEAADVLEGALKHDPDNAFIHNNYGFALYQIGKQEEGMSQIFLSRKLDPQNSWVNRNLAIIYLQKGDTAQACTEIQQGIELGFKDLYGDELEKLQAQHCR